MWKLPSLTPKSGRVVIALLLCIKLALLIWNAAVFDGRSYDADYHAERALSGGLAAGPTAYDPPLYYLPALLVKRPADVAPPSRNPEATASPGTAAARREHAAAVRAERAFRDGLLDQLRYSNVLWLGFFYVAWICYAFPRLLGTFQGWFLASLLLLALPGYQKLGVMSHPDNLFAACSALAVCAWLRLREGTENGPKQLFGLILAIGLLALTRPFALVPVAVLSIVACAYALRLSGRRWKDLLPQLALILVVAIGSGSGWYVYRWRHCSEPTPIYPTAERAPAGQGPNNVSFRQYYGTFKLHELVDPPVRRPARRGRAAIVDAPTNNSFFTLLYSEVWGDPWFYFSGPPQRDAKAWPKRLSLTSALLVPPVLAALVGLLLWDLARRARSELLAARDRGLLRGLLKVASAMERELVLLAIAGLGFGLFVYWQGGPALLPDESSSLKFIHIATLFPPLLGLAFSRQLERDTFSLLSGYLLLVFCATFPFAMYWPK